MSNISTWSSTAASNNSAAPDGFPEGQTPSSLNDCSRELMASVRTQHEDAQWIDLGKTTTYASATTFTIAGDVTDQFDVGRRIKATDSTTRYGVITASAYSSPNTTVTVLLDAGSLSASLTAVAVGIISGINSAVAVDFRAGVEAATDSNVFTDADHTKLNGITALHHGSIPFTPNTGTAAGSSGFTYSWAGAHCTITHSLGTNGYTIIPVCHYNDNPNKISYALPDSGNLLANTCVVVTSRVHSQAESAVSFYFTLMLD